MRRRFSNIYAYLALLVLSLPVPLLHHYRIDRMIESLRPGIKLRDGG